MAEENEKIELVKDCDPFNKSKHFLAAKQTTGMFCNKFRLQRPLGEPEKHDSSLRCQIGTLKKNLLTSQIVMSKKTDGGKHLSHRGIEFKKWAIKITSHSREAIFLTPHYRSHDLRGNASRDALRQVTTGRLNEQVKRNIEGFLNNFIFQLTENELEALLSQNAFLKKRGHYRKYLFYVFTEQSIVA